MANVHNTLWPEDYIIDTGQFGEHFRKLVSHPGLAGFAQYRVPTYVNLTREFVKSFNWQFSHGISLVTFSMYDQPRPMSLFDFCDSIRVSHDGSACRVLDKDRAIANFVQEISDRTIKSPIKGKLSGIQHPALRYLSYFIARGFNAKFEHTAINMHDLYNLMCAVYPQYKGKYNLGAICARHILSLLCVL